MLLLRLIPLQNVCISHKQKINRFLFCFFFSVCVCVLYQALHIQCVLVMAKKDSVMMTLEPEVELIAMKVSSSNNERTE